MTRKTTHIKLPPTEKKMAQMRATLLGVSFSEYLAQLIRTDAQLTGLVDLVQAESEEVDDAR